MRALINQKFQPDARNQLPCSILLHSRLDTENFPINFSLEIIEKGPSKGGSKRRVWGGQRGYLLT